MTETTIDTEVTHVLSWLPPYLVDGNDPVGFWELHTLADFMAGDPPLCDDWFADICKDADEGTLAQWAAGQLGFPVSLQADEQGLRPHRFVGRWHSEPLFWIRRAS